MKTSRIGYAVLCSAVLCGCALTAQESKSSTASASGAGHIYVVRHAEKESENADALSARGKERAACLAATLKDAKIKTVITSPFHRTEQTAQPTAEEFKVQIANVKADDYPAIQSKADAASKNGDVLIVGHSNTVPGIVKALANADVQIGGNEYDKLFVVDANGVAVLHYCPSSQPEPTSKMK